MGIKKPTIGDKIGTISQTMLGNIYGLQVRNFRFAIDASVEDFWLVIL